MVDILSEGRKIESRRQLEAIYRTNWKRNKRTPVNDHRRAGGRSKWTRSEARKARKRDSIRRMWIEKERETRGRKTSREDVIDMKHSKKRVAARNKTSWSLPASLNVTQAAVHKERWRKKFVPFQKFLDEIKKNYIFPGVDQNVGCQPLLRSRTQMLADPYLMNF